MVVSRIAIYRQRIGGHLPTKCLGNILIKLGHYQCLLFIDLPQL